MPATAAFTHLARLGLRSYQSFNTYWRGDGYSMKWHACNTDPTKGPKAYRTLCGRRFFDHGGDGEEFEGGVCVAKEGSRPSCKRCRRALGNRTAP